MDVIRKDAPAALPMGDGSYARLHVDDQGRLYVSGQDTTFEVSSGGTSQELAISTTSAASTAISGSASKVRVRVISSADCYCRQGEDPTALNDGTDEFLPAGLMVRMTMTSGNKLAFVAKAGTGTVNLTPEN